MGNQFPPILYARFTPEAARRALNNQTTAVFAGSAPHIRARESARLGG
jgi:hypothetical protein